MSKVEIWGWNGLYHKVIIAGTEYMAPTNLVLDYFGVTMGGEYSWSVVRAFLQDLEDLKNGL